MPKSEKRRNKSSGLSDEMELLSSKVTAVAEIGTAIGATINARNGR
jgi:hypothetical protein